MRLRLLLSPILLLICAHGFGQSLDFIGLTGLKFGMDDNLITGKVAILDSTSSYKDTATYIRNTRCVLYFRKNEKLQLPAFTASRVEYECCNKKLGYVFIRVSGEADIRKALDLLKKEFPRLKCSGANYDQCLVMDASAHGMRVITRLHKEQQELSFVIIPK